MASIEKSVTTRRKKDARPPASLAGIKANGHDPDELLGLLSAMQSLRNGDFSVRMDSGSLGAMGRIADCFNDIASSNERMFQELQLVGQAVGRDGLIRRRVKL